MIAIILISYLAIIRIGVIVIPEIKKVSMFFDTPLIFLCNSALARNFSECYGACPFICGYSIKLYFPTARQHY